MGKNHGEKLKYFPNPHPKRLKFIIVHLPHHQNKSKNVSYWEF